MKTNCQREDSPIAAARKRFFRDRGAVAGITGIFLLVLPALYAPLLVNGRPLIMISADGRISLPFAEFFFAPDSSEFFTEQIFNYLALLLPVLLIIHWLPLHRKAVKGILAAAAVLLLCCPFITAVPRLDRTDYRDMAVRNPDMTMVFAPIPYTPYEAVAAPVSPPDRQHICGTDAIGRDLAARLVYGARASLAVGIGSTALALMIGIAVGLAAGFFRGTFDLLVMRGVEILLCFPTFLLLLILMSMLSDRDFGQSIPIVVAVIGLTGWIGLALLVRGETLKQRTLPYVEGGIASGIPAWRIMFRHILPNVTAPILISFTFGVAGAIMAESGLSFLGFGVQPPTASWGELLRQAFEDPLAHRHLTFFPGAALFIAVLSFNLTGEGLRKALDIR